MDFHGMKRKQLQALCKKHGVPANLTNRAMADRLASMFKEENEEPASSEELISNPEKLDSEIGAKVTKKQAKKVRFSPDNQTFVYEVSAYGRPSRRSRRLSKNPALVTERGTKSENIGKAADSQVRVRRSRVQNAVEDMVFSPPVGRKRGRGGMKGEDGEVNSTGKNAFSQNALPEKVSADDSLPAPEVAKTEKPLRRSKRNAKGDCAKSATVLIQSETAVTKLQEQSEGDAALEKPPEGLRRYPSRRKSVVSGKGGNEEELGKRRYSLRPKSVVPQSGKGENEEKLGKMKTRKRARMAELDAIVEQSDEVERAEGKLTSQDNAPLRRSRRRAVLLNTTTSATDRELANKGDMGKMQQLSATFLGKDETAELPRKSIRNASRYNSSETSKEGSDRGSGANQCGFGEDSLLILEMEENKDSAGNIEETLIATSVNVVGVSTDCEIHQSADKPMEFCENESNILGNERETLVHGSNVRSEENCMSLQSADIKCVLDDSNRSEKKFIDFESNANHVDSSEITFPTESQAVEDTIASAEIAIKIGDGMSDQEMKEDTHSAPESLVVYEEDGNPVGSDEGDTEMNAHHLLCWSVDGKGSVNDPVLFETRPAEFESKVTNLDSSDTSLANALSLTADQVDLTGATTSVLNPEKQLETEPPEGESSIFASDTVNIDASRIFKSKISEESNNTNVTTFESLGVATFEDHLNEFVDNSVLKKAEQMIPIDSLSGEGIQNMESSSKLTENQESSAEFHFAMAEAGGQRITEVQQSTYANTVAPEYQGIEKTCRFEAAANSNLVEPGMIDFESNGSKVISPEITSPADDFSPASRPDLARKIPSYTDVVKVLETKDPLTAETIDSINVSMDADESRSTLLKDQIELQLEDANLSAAEPIAEALFSDLLNELGESIGSKRGSEIPFVKTEKLTATELSDGEEISLNERSTEAMEMKENKAEIDIVSDITGTPNITENIRSLNSEITACRSASGLASQSQDKPCNAGITVSLVRSEMSNQDEETTLVEDEETLEQDDTIEGETKYEPCMSLNKRDALDKDLAESKMVEVESNANKVICYEMTSLAGDFSSTSQANLAVENLNELNLEKELEPEESPKVGNMTYKCDKIEVEDTKIPAQEDQTSMYLEDASMTADEPVPEVVIWDHSNELSENCTSKEFEVSFIKAEETGVDYSSGKEMVQTRSSVKINEKIEATAKVNNDTAETGEKIFTEMQWSLSSHDSFLISPIGPKVGSQDMQVENAVSSAGCGMSGQEKNEENVEIVEIENEQTINSERELFIGGKMIFDEGCEENFLVDTIACPLLDSTESPCSKGKQNAITEGSCNKIHLETEAKHIFEVFEGEGTNHVSSEEKDNDSFSMRIHDHVLVDAEKNCCGETVNQSLNNNIAATMNSNGISTIRETDVGQDDNIVGETALSGLKVELGGQGDCKMDAELHDTNTSMLDTILQETEVELGGQGDCKMDAELHDTNTSMLDTILQETDASSVVRTEFPEGIPNASVRITMAFEKANCDDQGEGVAPQHDFSSSIGLDGFTSTVGMIIDDSPKVGSMESTLNGNNPQFLPQVTDDIDDVGKTEISIDRKVAGEDRDENQINTRVPNDVLNGSSVEESRGDLIEIAQAKSDGCEASVKTATFVDCTDSLVVSQPLCLDESKSCDRENEEPHGLHKLHLPSDIASESRDVGSCGKLDIVSSVIPEIDVSCLSISSICATSYEHKGLENPDESHILTNTEMSFFGVIENANAGDSNYSALDKTITECNPSDLKEGNYAACSDAEDTKMSAKKDGPQVNEETSEIRKDVSGLNTEMADSEVAADVEYKEAFRKEIDLLLSQKKSATAKKEGSRSVFLKQLSSSMAKSKNKSNLIQRTPKRLVINDMKENEPTAKREQMGNRTTPKTSARRRPLEHVPWKF
ncbi:hypothetical protein COLO4_29877 [Corchorus olitorius]|uniref:Uncharacterized protein n=1 Tax=Corchorus olitorius TaxID=93759 RepID=A0A1R3HCT0_9ROSI|nr:hypothetical protein COLO4_29877 [Corchorus olitorius]